MEKVLLTHDLTGAPLYLVKVYRGLRFVPGIGITKELRLAKRFPRYVHTDSCQETFYLCSEFHILKKLTVLPFLVDKQEQVLPF